MSQKSKACPESVREHGFQETRGAVELCQLRTGRGSDLSTPLFRYIH